MKINAKFLYGPILFILVALVAGCDDFLSETSPSNISMDSYYTKPEHAASAVNAIYEDLRSVFNGGGFGGAAWLMYEFPTGLTNTIALGSSGPVNSSIRMLDMNADNGYLNTVWNSHYRGIANANVAIAKIPGIQMEASYQERLLGEARFLRAYYYFNLVRTFGDVPLILEPLDISSQQLYPEKSTIAEVYEIIVRDLEWAEASGLPFTDPSGKISLGTVKSLMSVVYLTMAGYPLQGGAAYYEKARDKALEVINSGNYRLFNTYADLKNEDTENMGEHIFMVQYDKSIANRNAFQSLFLPNGMNLSLFSDETGMIFPVEEFVSSYETEDIRAREKQFFYKEFTLESNRNKPIDLGSWYIYKWFDQAAHTETASSGLNWPLIRYAEILFVFAEAENEISGPTTASYEVINTIRSRAGLVPLSGLDQETFRSSIWEEKWHELCFENKTWFDMVRIRKSFNLQTKQFDDLLNSKFIYGPVFTEKNLLFPLPTSEILNNDKLKQNIGY